MLRGRVWDGGFEGVRRMNGGLGMKCWSRGTRSNGVVQRTCFRLFVSA